MKLVLLLVFWFTTAVSINVDKCCPLNSVFDVSTNKCFAFNSSITISETSLLFNKHKPKIFSLESEDFIEEGISATDYRLPSCPAGEKYTIIQNIEDEENFVLIKEDGSLFKTEDGSTEAMFCIDSIIRQNTVVGHLAVLCGISEEKVCSGLFCINNCCPEGTVYKTNLGECQPTSEFKFPQLLKETVKSVNPTLPGEGWEDSLKIYYREPNCSHLHIYSEDEFEVEAEGWLRAGQTILPYTQFCLNPVQQYNSTVLQAKVCSGIDENDLLIYSVLSQQIIPVLIILSEIFLFLTFSLHVLVPEFRKQIFGWMKMCTVASLFLSYQWFLIILFGGDLLIQEYPALCQLMGFLIQFCFLCSFTWMTTMSIEVWLTFRKLTANSETDARQRSQRRRFKQYNLFSFGTPLLVTVCTIAVHFTPDHLKENIISPGFGEGSCFIEGYLAKILYFHGLIALLLAVNLVLFIISAYSLLLGVWAPARDEQGSRRINGQMTWIVFELFLVMGLTWGSEILTISIDWAHSTSHYLGPLPACDIRFQRCY
ncbi:probable G-protein coupled receptor Mth-like 1 [Eurytemora carolleeae]|uniref:probable G-protein coupled receptor Mth-like 1 n=1 Tax=Eurytemora carolleeae TaxID=1294199 RepID=UPI000C787CC1|nr:probable G-protein coupled receptor Mth-like 1 [Eurytemora carolleeae]|eukprot:XP_023323247.1 probable G-protein coupled receptor Mth-like 1 [Eurytemora affinis]